MCASSYELNSKMGKKKMNQRGVATQIQADNPVPCPGTLTALTLAENQTP
jgi:hypothetical protein